MNRFVVKAALEAAGERELGATAPSEAISALQTLGYPLGDAKSAVRGFCEASSTDSLGTEEILAGVLRAKGAELCQ